MTNYKKILKQINKEELEEFMLEIIIENPYVQMENMAIYKVNSKKLWKYY